MTTTDERRRHEQAGAAPPLAETGVSERDARKVAEAARETEWRAPSFGKELFLGRFRLDLVHPLPPADPAQEDAGRGVPGPAARLPRARGRRRRDRARRADPRPRAPRAGRHRLPRDEDRHRVRRARAEPARVQPGARADRLGEPVDRRADLGPPVDRRPAAGQAVRHRRAEAALPPPLRQDRHQRVPAHRARRRLRPGPARHHRDADRGRQRVRAGRAEALDHQRRDRRPARRDGAGAQGPRATAAGITAFVVEGDAPGVTVEHRNALHGPARHRERRHPPRPGASSRSRTASARRARGSRSRSPR